jgi:hypothetical protein
MRLTVTKGILPDRVVVGFWIGDKVQNVIVSYTELRDILNKEDLAEVFGESLGIWKAHCEIKLIKE